MILARFVDGERILVDITVLTPDGEEKEIAATLDTGFVGTIFLPYELVLQWQLPRVSQELVFLADGTLTRLPTYEVTILWDEEERTIEALTAPRPSALIGIELLRGCSATLSFYEGGECLIETEI